GGVGASALDRGGGAGEGRADATAAGVSGGVGMSEPGNCAPANCAPANCAPGDPSTIAGGGSEGDTVVLSAMMRIGVSTALDSALATSAVPDVRSTGAASS